MPWLWVSTAVVILTLVPSWSRPADAAECGGKNWGGSEVVSWNRHNHDCSPSFSSSAAVPVRARGYHHFPVKLGARI